MGSLKQINQQSQSPVSFVQKLLIARWRSLLLLFIGVYLPLQVFELLAVKLWRYEAGFAWDLPILLAIHSTAEPQLDVIAVLLTRLGSFWTALPILSAIALILWQRKRWRSLVYLIITGLGSTIINSTAKEVLHRVRPQLWHSSAPESDFAFPSGHAMTSMTLVAILVILTWVTSWRWLVLLSGSLFVLTIAWTRLYLGVHFPSDILAGWMVAIAWAIGVSIIIKPNLTKPSVIGDETQEETSLLPEETQLVEKE